MADTKNSALPTQNGIIATDKVYMSDAAGPTSKAATNITIASGASVSGSNTGDQTLPVKATGAEIDTGTDDAKFATAKALADSTKFALASKFVAGAGALTGPASPLTVGTAAASAVGDFATSTQGGKADTAVQPNTAAALTSLSLTANNNQIILNSDEVSGYTMTVTGTATSSAKVITLPDATGTVLLSGGALGTPSSGTLTNATGLPVAAVAGDTATALGVGTLELGHASDTTLSRSAAGVLAVENVVIPSISSTNTLTNKRITERVTTTTDDATAVIDTDSCDEYQLSAVANATEFTLTGTPTDGQPLIVRIKDAGVSKALTWTGFTAIGCTLPAATTAGKWHYIGCRYNSAAAAWHALTAIVQA